jgi:hypothetical protein
MFTLIFGVVLYAIIRFDYTDEICALALFSLFAACMFGTTDWEINKAFLVTLFIFIFYLSYSIFIGSNTKSGIFNDFFVEIKPYLAFFCVYSIKSKLSEGQKSIVKPVCVLVWGILFSIGIGELFIRRLTWIIFEHTSHYAAAVLIVSLCYLFCSKFTLRERIQFVLMLSIGLLSGRSKFYGFFALSVFMTLIFPYMKEFKLNLRSALALVGMLGIMILVAWEKIDVYFYQVLNGELEEDLVARFILYATMPMVLIDYFPFGSGFASFATYSSGVYYSHLYDKYGISGVWGISRDYYAFVADTYYPALAQFGVMGLILYASFWLYLFAKARTFYMVAKEENKCNFVLIILIISYIAIEGIADATFTSYRGFFVMMLAAAALTEMKERSATNVTGDLSLSNNTSYCT